MTRMELCTPDHPALALLPAVPTRDQLEHFGQLLLSLESEHGLVDIGTQHHHAESLYGRSVVIKAETFVAGAVHKIEGFVVCVGDITVWTERGRERYTGAHILTSQPGPRVVFAHTDTTWFTVHPNNTGGRDINAIESAIVEQSHRLMTRRAPQVLQ